MFFVDTLERNTLLNPFNFVPPRVLKVIEDGWPGVFRKLVLPVLPCELMAPFFCHDNGRRSKDIRLMMGTLILQQAFDFTDTQTCLALLTDRCREYALNIVDPGSLESNVSLRTYRTFRKLVADNGMFKPIFDSVTKNIATSLNVNLDNQRLDSTHFQSDMKKMSRLGLVVKTTDNFLKNLKKKFLEDFEKLDPKIQEKIDKNDNSENDYFSGIKPSERTLKLEYAIKDMHHPVNIFKDNVDVISMNSFKHLQRVLNDQCTIEIIDGVEIVKLKEPKEVSGDSLQNPSDPDAGYSGHKGQGYHLQIVETCPEPSEEKITDKKIKKPIQLIVYTAVEAANMSDTHALIPAINDLDTNEFLPKKLLADTLYGSEENIKFAKNAGIELISPTPGNAPKEKFSIAKFQISDGGIVNKCPEAQKPRDVSLSLLETGQMRIYFDLKICSNCPKFEFCPIKVKNDLACLSYSASRMAIAKHRLYELTEAFKIEYRVRAGVEATNSDLKRRFRLGRLRVRGFSQVALVATFKALALNIARALSMAPNKVALDS